jgi:hypothetical protein
MVASPAVAGPDRGAVHKNDASLIKRNNVKFLITCPLRSCYLDSPESDTL